MRTHGALILATLALTAVSGCAMTRSTDDAGAADGADTTPMMTRADTRLQSYRIHDWSAPNERTLIVESITGERYRADLMNNCIGLRFTNSLAFVTGGTNQLDRYSGIVLPDGTRCMFRSFTRIADSERRSAEAEPKENKESDSEKAE